MAVVKEMMMKMIGLVRQMVMRIESGLMCRIRDGSGRGDRKDLGVAL